MNVLIQNVLMLSVVILSVARLNVEAPLKSSFKIRERFFSLPSLNQHPILKIFSLSLCMDKLERLSPKKFFASLRLRSDGRAYHSGALHSLALYE